MTKVYPTGEYYNLPQAQDQVNYQNPNTTTRVVNTGEEMLVLPPNVRPFPHTATQSEIDATTMKGNGSIMFASWNSFGPSFWGTGFCFSNNGGTSWSGNFQMYTPNSGDPGAIIWPTGSTWSGRLGLSCIPGKLPGADLIRAAMALSLPFITDVWQIYIVIFLLQSASATFTPALQSLIPTILKGEKDYIRALSLSRLAYDMEALVSPAIAALLLTAVSYNNLFLGTVGGFLFSAVMVATTVLPKVPAASGQLTSLWHRTTLGARMFWRNRRLRSLLALNLVVAAPTALVLVNTVVYVRDVLHRPNTDLALASACFGFGSMIVALSAPRVLDRFGDRPVMLTGAAVIPFVLAGAAALTLLGVPGMGWRLLLSLWFLLGAANSTILTPV